LKSKPFLERLVSQWPAKALSLVAAILLFLFHNYSSLAERFVNIPLKVVFAEGFTAAQPYPRRVRVTVRGRDQNLSDFSENDIEAIVDFSQFNKEGTYRAPVQIKRKRVVEDPNLMEFRVEPVEVMISIERKVQKRVEVIPTFKGTLLSGYELSQYYVSPSLITVEGPASKIKNLSSVPTEEIDLTGKKGDFITEVRLLRNDPLLFFPAGDIVEFRGFVQETTILKTFEEVNIVVLDLRPDLRLTKDLPKGTIRVQGGQSLLDTIESGQVRLVVDCRGIVGPGTYTMPTRTDIPSGLLVLRYEPNQVTLIVEHKE